MDFSPDARVITHNFRELYQPRISYFCLHMNPAPKYSVVIPVYNRPEELEELLQSLAEQRFNDFDVIIVEDGSQRTSESVYEKFASRLAIRYFSKPNSGPGPSRNFGFEKAKGQYFVVFDSDCILPPEYFEAVEKFLELQPLDAWGGPDRGHKKFSPLQQAMAHTMSSILTTGGIRGGANHASRFLPRSFNMGISKAVFEKTGGFAFDRLAEDIELSIRMKKTGFRVGLIPGAYVYHKRRTNLRDFFYQVQGFGRGRARVGKVHPEEVKLTHWFPAVFFYGLISIPFMFLYSITLGSVMAFLLSAYLGAIFLDGLRVSHSLSVALLSIPSAIVQLSGYGIGFLNEKLK